MKNLVLPLYLSMIDIGSFVSHNTIIIKEYLVRFLFFNPTEKRKKMLDKQKPWNNNWHKNELRNNKVDVRSQSYLTNEAVYYLSSTVDILWMLLRNIHI